MKNKVVLFLLIILIIASFFRLWQLDTIPPGLYPDEAINGNEAILNPGQIFYPENNGREGLFINLISLSFLIFGISIWSLKIVPAVIGILTILGLYLLTKELFSTNNPTIQQSNNPTIIALLSSFFLAISFWHVNFSRIDFRAILLPFVLVFAFYFLFRAFRKKSLSDFSFSGIFWGLGFYTYISYRLAILVLAVVLVLKLIEYFRENKIQFNFKWAFRKFYLKDSWWKINIFLFIIILVALPIGIYFLQNPQDFISRAGPISVFAQDNSVKAFFISFISHLGMFNFYGDSNWRHNFAGSPQLLWPIGILFLIGIGFSIKKIIESIQNRDYPLFPIPYFFLLAWFFIMLFPGILTFEGIPHALRVIGVIPVVYIFTGMGGWLLYEWAAHGEPRLWRGKKIIQYKKLFFALCALFLVFVTLTSFNKYFFDWAKNPEVEGAFSKNYVKIGNYLNSLPPETQTYVIVNEPGVLLYGISIPAQTPMFIETIKFGQPRSVYVKAEDLDQIKTDQEKTVIVPLYNGRLFDELQKKFPQGKIKEKNGFDTYEIE